jgi:hypothetical protein
VVSVITRPPAASTAFTVSLANARQSPPSICPPRQRKLPPISPASSSSQTARPCAAAALAAARPAGPAPITSRSQRAFIGTASAAGWCPGSTRPSPAMRRIIGSHRIQPSAMKVL